MKKWIIIWMCIILAACTPVSTPEAPVTNTEIIEAPVTITEPPVQNKAELATRTVKQTGNLGTFVYGLTENNRLVRVEKTGAVWNYQYKRDKLIEITGPQDIEFFYNQGILEQIDVGNTRLTLIYDIADRVVELKGLKQTWYFEYNSLNQLTRVRRGVAGETNLEYTGGKVSKILRGNVPTTVSYDDKGRVRSFDSHNGQLILGYWRDNKLVSLSGKKFGPGLTVSYGPLYPAFEAKFVHEADDSIFNSAYTDTLYEVVDEYLYCKYVRHLKELMFEGPSYTFFLNYYNGNVADYLQQYFVCVPYEA